MQKIIKKNYFFLNSESLFQEKVEDLISNKSRHFEFK